MEKPFFSIVTVCYNSEKTIEHTIKSVLAQDFKDYEYIIVDGGSQDGTVNIIKKYEPLFDGRMKWESETDKGIYDAFNKGILRSIGKYVWIVNSDDYIEPNILFRLNSEILTNNNPDIVSGVVRFIENGEHSRNWKYDYKSSEIEFKKKRLGVAHPATVVRKDIYTTMGMYDPWFKISGDLEWFLTVREKGAKVFFSGLECTNWTEGGVSCQKHHKQLYKEWKYTYRKHTSNIIEYYSFLIYRIITYIKNYILK